jgi:hypothetical protein
VTVRAAHRWPTNAHLIADAARLGYLAGHVVDVTHGRGVWWQRWHPDRLTCHDLHTGDGVDWRRLPEADSSVDAVAFDPPYRLNGTPDLGDFDNRFGLDTEYVPWQARHAGICEGISEAARIVRPAGCLLLKCQDQVCSGAVRWQTREFADHAETVGFVLVDRFDMLAPVRKQPVGRTQKHAHGRPSTLLVFRWFG